MNAFELRAAARSARVTVQLARIKAPETSQSETKAKRSLALDREAISNLKLKGQAFLKFLDRYMKRANRRFQSERSRDEFNTLSREWRSHLQWIRFHLAYFKPFRPLGPGQRRVLRWSISRLVRMADVAIADQGFELPDLGKLRRVIRMFVHYSRRGRQGFKHHLYMLKNREKPFAQRELLEFIQQRLALREEQSVSGTLTEPKKTEHRIAALDPIVRAKIEELGESWRVWDKNEREKHIKSLREDGCSVRGLAEDIGVPETTLRQYATLPIVAKKRARRSSTEMPAQKEVKEVPPGKERKDQGTPEKQKAAIPTIAPSLDAQPQATAKSKDVSQAIANRIQKGLRARSLSEAERAKIDEISQILVEVLKPENARSGSFSKGFRVRMYLSDARLKLNGDYGDFVATDEPNFEIGAAEFVQEAALNAPPSEIIDLWGDGLARIVASMTSNKRIRLEAIAAVGRSAEKLWPKHEPEQPQRESKVEPSSQVLPVPEEALPLKAYEMRLKQYAATHPEWARTVAAEPNPRALDTRRLRYKKGS